MFLSRKSTNNLLSATPGTSLETRRGLNFIVRFNLNCRGVWSAFSKYSKQILGIRLKVSGPVGGVASVCLFTRYLNFRPIFPPVAVTLSQCIRCDGGRESSAGSETGWRFKLSFTRDVGGSSALGSGISNFDQGIREKLCKCLTLQPGTTDGLR